MVRTWTDTISFESVLGWPERVILMSDALSSAVSKLRASSARLNQLTDDAATTVKQVEDFLGRECSIGIPTRLQVHKAAESGDNDDTVA